MVTGFAWLLALQWLGEVLVRLAGLPVPGPVLGMALLLGWLTATGGPSPTLDKTSTGLLAHLSLLFVPAGVGVIAHLGPLADAALPLTAAIVVGTVVALVVTGLVTQALAGSEAQ